MKVFVLDRDKEVLNPCHPAKARKLLREGNASVFRHFPFTIILKAKVSQKSVQPLRLKLDPGSKTTGLAVVNDKTGEVVFAQEITHRSNEIRDSLLKRRAIRRGRRSRHTRYRQPRFLNRTRKERWLPPSLESRLSNIETWVRRCMRSCPINAFSVEMAKFDTQKMQNAEISGVEYQQGELQGYEVREYLLEKFKRRCAYCKKGNIPLEIEHIVPSSRGGSNRVSNLTLACSKCNQRKGTKTATEFGHKELQKQAQVSLKDASAMNASRLKLLERLKGYGVLVETGTGSLTKYNRSSRKLAKSHWLDAVCVGESTPEKLKMEGVKPLRVKAEGQGRRKKMVNDAEGFAKGYIPKEKSFRGFQTGDIVRAKIPTGKHKGIHQGRIAIRHRPSFKLNGFDVHPKYLTLLQKADGYNYV